MFGKINKKFEIKIFLIILISNILFLIILHIYIIIFLKQSLTTQNNKKQLDHVFCF